MQIKLYITVLAALGEVGSRLAGGCVRACVRAGERAARSTRARAAPAVLPGTVRCTVSYL